MLSHRLPISRLVFSGRPPRPPNPAKGPPTPRPFTHNSQLLLVSGIGPRPQLPFLHPATRARSPPNLPRTLLQYQLSRLMTTERKLWLKDELRKGAKWTVYGWMFLSLLSIMTFGILNEAAERKYHSPPDWTMFTRMLYRAAKTAENPDPNGSGLIGWSSIGHKYCRMIKRLEDPSIDGQGLRPVLQDEGDIYVAGVGKAGLDISSKSEPWRRGYCACLMGAATAAENRDGYMRDTTRDIVYPPEEVIGPSNPRPKPVPYGSGPAPLEENCVPVFEPAETYYMKVLTTHGFNARQRLNAALAYADWLDFKGLPSTAEEMYDWGLDIAMGALPVGVNNVIDIKTGVINSKAAYISSNVILASTSLAIHHARNNNLAAALPIFLSVLRARRQLPTPVLNEASKSESKNESGLSSAFSFFKSLIITPPPPPEPPMGDEIPARTPAAMCEEAGLMSHIGEILFASSAGSNIAKTPSDSSVGPSIPLKATVGQLKNQQSGLSWTREAVDLAETTLVSAEKDDVAARDTCSECLAVGMDNWSMMVTKMLRDERRATPEAQQKTGSWFWGSGPEVDGVARWEREARLVDERLGRVQRLLNKEADRQASSGFSLFM